MTTRNGRQTGPSREVAGGAHATCSVIGTLRHCAAFLEMLEDVSDLSPHLFDVIHRHIPGAPLLCEVCF